MDDFGPQTITLVTNHHLCALFHVAVYATPYGMRAQKMTRVEDGQCEPEGED